MEDDFRDLAPLDPARDPARWERMVGSVMTAAGPELARRASLPQPGLQQRAVPALAQQSCLSH